MDRWLALVFEYSLSIQDRKVKKTKIIKLFVSIQNTYSSKTITEKNPWLTFVTDIIDHANTSRDTFVRYLHRWDKTRTDGCQSLALLKQNWLLRRLETILNIPHGSTLDYYMILVWFCTFNTPNWCWLIDCGNFNIYW